jgi:hypothetical protein
MSIKDEFESAVAVANSALEQFNAEPMVEDAKRLGRAPTHGEWKGRRRRTSRQAVVGELRPRPTPDYVARIFGSWSQALREAGLGEWVGKKRAEVKRCRNGHLLIPENIYFDRRGYRCCRECHRRGTRESHRRRTKQFHAEDLTSSGKKRKRPMRRPPKALSARQKQAIPRLLESHTYQEVADRFGVSAMTVWRWHNRGADREVRKRRRNQ